MFLLYILAVLIEFIIVGINISFFLTFNSYYQKYFLVYILAVIICATISIIIKIKVLKNTVISNRVIYWFQGYLIYFFGVAFIISFLISLFQHNSILLNLSAALGISMVKNNFEGILIFIREYYLYKSDVHSKQKLERPIIKHLNKILNPIPTDKILVNNSQSELSYPCNIYLDPLMYV